MKKYQVIFQDEYNNLYHLGFYDKLEESLEDINNQLKVYNLHLDEIKERAGSFGRRFDVELITEDGECIMIRGFIFE